MAVIIEEPGLPIPTDFMIVLAGAALLLIGPSLAPLVVLRDETTYLTASGGWSPMLASVALGAAACAVTIAHGREPAVSRVRLEK